MQDGNTLPIRGVTCGLVLCLGFCAQSATSQSKVTSVFENFRRTGDQSALRRELVKVSDSGIDLQVDLPVLVSIVSDSKNRTEQTAASGIICALAYQHANEANVFLPAVH